MSRRRAKPTIASAARVSRRQTPSEVRASRWAARIALLSAAVAACSAEQAAPVGVPSGTAEPGRVSIAEAYDFGEVTAGEQPFAYIHVANLGPGTIRLASFEITEGDPKIWEVSPAFDEPLADQMLSGIIVTYKPCPLGATARQCPPREDSARLRLRFDNADDPKPVRLSARIVPRRAEQ